MAKNNRFSSLLLVIFLLLISGCSAGSTSSTLPTIKIGWMYSKGDFTLLASAELGYFKDLGVNVVPIHYGSASQEISDLAGAELDGCILSMNDVFLASNLADIKAVFVTDNGGQYSIVASPDIQNVQALRGKRIGLNRHTSSEMVVYYMLEGSRMSPADVDYVEIPPAQVLKALPNQIDAGVVWEPYTSQAISEGKKVIYQTTPDSSLIPRLLVFRSSFAKQNGDLIRAFIQDWNKGVSYQNDHPQESLALLSQVTGLFTSDPILTTSGDSTLYSTNDNLKLFADDPGTDPSSIYYVAGFNRDFLVKIGYITNPPDINVLLDSSFLR